MADFKTPFITASENTSRAVVQPNHDKRVRSVLVHWSKLAAETDGDVIYLFEMKSSDVLDGVYYQGEAITGLSATTLGLFTAKSAPVVVDADILMATTDLSAGSAQYAQIDGLAPSNVGKPVWSLLGQTEPEDKTYYVGLTLATGGTATGDIVFRFDFLV